MSKELVVLIVPIVLSSANPFRRGGAVRARDLVVRGRRPRIIDSNATNPRTPRHAPIMMVLSFVLSEEGLSAVFSSVVFVGAEEIVIVGYEVGAVVGAEVVVDAVGAAVVAVVTPGAWSWHQFKH